MILIRRLMAEEIPARTGPVKSLIALPAFFTDAERHHHVRVKSLYTLNDPADHLLRIILILPALKNGRQETELIPPAGTGNNLLRIKPEAPDTGIPAPYPAVITVIPAVIRKLDQPAQEYLLPVKFIRPASCKRKKLLPFRRGESCAEPDQRKIILGGKRLFLIQFSNQRHLLSHMIDLSVSYIEEKSGDKDRGRFLSLVPCLLCSAFRKCSRTFQDPHEFFARNGLMLIEILCQLMHLLLVFFKVCQRLVMLLLYDPDDSLVDQAGRIG